MSTAARNFGDEIFDSIVEWMANNLSPEDVFDDTALGEWAINNGYVSKDARDAAVAEAHEEGYRDGQQDAES